jgi:hypothetical protein
MSWAKGWTRYVAPNQRPTDKATMAARRHSARRVCVSGTAVAEDVGIQIQSWAHGHSNRARCRRSGRQVKLPPRPLLVAQVVR